MHLKNLSVVGFKSFADKISLQFERGITAIVGPNGCGKSNIADAIRWVLGEQSAKALRGTEMADVIFNGTENRKPTGMAEVSLTVSDIRDENLRAAGVDIAFSEVTLRRRVFRDGGSDYFINKVPCRLKDIQQLFMGTGVGRGSYSILAQGNITQILSSRPEDRRLVFEEAAGITRFKTQKREALRKLDSTEQNLLRVADLIREVQRQIGSLQRQANKARRYKEIQAELQDLETRWAGQRYQAIQTERQIFVESIEAFRDEGSESQASMRVLEEEIEQGKRRLAALADRIQEAHENDLRLRHQIETHEQRIKLNLERLSETEIEEQRTRREIGEATRRRDEGVAELATTNQQLELSRKARGQMARELEEKRVALAAADREVLRLDATLKDAREGSFTTAQALTHARNEITALEGQIQRHENRKNKLVLERQGVQDEQETLQKRLEAATVALKEDRRVSERLRLQLTGEEARRKEVQGQVDALSGTLEIQRREQAQEQSRLELLRELEDAHQGYGSGTAAALERAKESLGILADRIQVPKRYIPAIESALGHALEIVLVEDFESASSLWKALVREPVGRLSLAALNRPGWERPWRSYGRVPAGRPALGVVDADRSVQGIVDRLLRPFVIVEDLDTAIAAWMQGEGRLNFVTESGEILDRDGVLSGHSQTDAEQGTVSILTRKHEIQELDRLLLDLEGQLREGEARLNALTGDLRALDVLVGRLAKELNDFEVSIATRSARRDALQETRRLLEDKLRALEFEIETLDHDRQAAHDLRAEGVRRRDELQDQDNRLRVALEETAGKLERMQARRKAVHASTTECQVALAKEEQYESALTQRQGPLERRLKELGEQIQRYQRDIEHLGQRKEQGRADTARSRESIERFKTQRSEMVESECALSDQKREQDTSNTRIERQLKDQRNRLDALQERRKTAEIELAQKTMEAENLHKRIYEKYRIQLETLGSAAPEPPAGAGGRPSPEDAATPVASPAEDAREADWDAVAQEMGVLRKRIDSMGPVNLVAIAEYEETEKRFEFLNSQHEDLTKAKRELYELINRIDTQTRRMFTDTFNQIRASFRELFEEIFGGGSADLRLVEQADVLESGIEIVARPPGKRLQSISLLSGGEQTMTAVALLFAIYQVRPSPFCVLDELDAPLDESNIDRFLQVLHRFLIESQFIIITHNKRTIEIAEVLYGITMQERGVSKVVSVKFHKKGDRRLSPAQGPREPGNAPGKGPPVSLANNNAPG